MPDGFAPTGSAAIPDSRGLNLLHADPALLRVASLYVPADLLDHLRPHLERLGGLAGASLDELAGRG